MTRAARIAATLKYHVTVIFLPMISRCIRFFKRADALAIYSLFAIGALVYGVLIPSLGFYWDDWPVIWVYNALGSRGLTTYFAGDRPVSGWIFANLAPIIGNSPIGWQVISLVLRCASSAVLYAMFSALWPKRKDFAWLVGALVLLYPGFTQQPIALSYLPHHLSFFFFVVSLATTIFSFTRPAYRWLFLPFSLGTGIISYLITEYFVGLEIFRLMVIATLISRKYVIWTFTKLKTVLIVWSPYMTVWTTYVVWRAFVFRVASHYGTVSEKNVGSDISRLLRSPIHEGALRVLGGIHNILMASFIAMARPFSPDLITPLARSVILSWAIAITILGIMLYMLGRLTTPHPAGESEGSPRAPNGSILLGIVGLLVAGLPFVASGQTTEFVAHPSFPDRFTIPFMLGVSLLLSGLLFFLGTTRLSRMLFVSPVLLAFSAYQVQNMNLYRRDWLTQRSLFWQLAWRAPMLNQGTSIFVDGLPRSLIGNHSAGILDLLYKRDGGGGRLDYFIFDLTQSSIWKLPGAAEHGSYRPGTLISGHVRSFQFQGTTDQSLVFWLSPSGTLRIVTRAHENEILGGSALCANISYLSRPGEVISNAPGLPDGPLLKIFGPEPKTQWLYFYQRAELERQLEHWDAVALLGDEAVKQGYGPRDPSEWFPFIEGYTRTHRYRTAADISIRMLEEYPEALAPLSSLWLRAKREDVQNSEELRGVLGVLADKLLLQDSQ